MLAPPMATVPVQLIVYRSSFSWPGRYGITPSPFRLYSVVRRWLEFTRACRKFLALTDRQAWRPTLPSGSERSYHPECDCREAEASVQGRL